jgi:outer membrane lipoprotein SlyB
MKHATMTVLACLLLATGCAKQQSQTQYKQNEVGRQTQTEFGTIITTREVGITGENTGVGGLVGAGVGAGAGSYAGKGSGNVWAIAGGALAGAAIGALAEQAHSDGKGIEYVITTESGKTITVVQNLAADDVVLQAGQRAMVQTTGSYQRVLPADHMPDAIKRPKGIKVVD